MNIHKNARLTPRGRELLVRHIVSGQALEAAARAAGVCPRTARKWLARFLAEGVEGLQDRSSRPNRLYRPTPPEIIERVEALRRQRWTGKQIAAELDISPATVSRILKRLGLNRISSLEPAEPVRRYERETPRLLADPARREEGERRRLPQGRCRLLRQSWRHCGEGDDRQRLLLPFEGFPQSLPRSRPEAHQDQALYPQDQRQGGTLHPDRAPRMGLRTGLSDLGPPRRGAAGLAPSIQLASPARQPKIKTAHQQTRSQPGQPVEAPHLRPKPVRVTCPSLSTRSGRASDQGALGRGSRPDQIVASSVISSPRVERVPNATHAERGKKWGRIRRRSHEALN